MPTSRLHRLLNHSSNNLNVKYTIDYYYYSPVWVWEGKLFETFLCVHTRVIAKRMSVIIRTHLSRQVHVRVFKEMAIEMGVSPYCRCLLTGDTIYWCNLQQNHFKLQLDRKVSKVVKITRSGTNRQFWHNFTQSCSSFFFVFCLNCCMNHVNMFENFEK